MSCVEAEDLNTLVGKLANFMANTIRSCIGNYKSLLPYLGKKETSSKICNKLVHVNILLNKLNEELLALRVEYVSVSSYEQKIETVLSEGGRKRTASNVLGLTRLKSKSMKMEVPFSSKTKCSVALNLEAGINIQSENSILNNTEETIDSQLLTLDMNNVKNIKKVIEGTNETEDFHEFPINNSQIPVPQKSCDTTNNEMTVCFAGDEGSTSVADVENNANDKSAGTITQIENNELCVPLQSVKRETRNQVEFEVSVKNIKKEVEDSNEALNVHELPINGSQIPVAHKSCGTTNIENEMTVCFAGDKVTASVAGSLMGNNADDKSAGSISQREKNEVCVPLQTVKSKTSSEANCEYSGNIHEIRKGLKRENGCVTSFSYPAIALNSKESSVTSTASEKESAVLVEERANSCNKGEGRSLRSVIRYEKDYVPVQSRAEEKVDVAAWSRSDDLLYGIIKIKEGMYRCTLCNRKLVCETAVSCHVRGKQHEKARITGKKNSCTKESEGVPYGIVKLKTGKYRCTLCSRKLVCDTAMLGHVRGKQHKTSLITSKNNGRTKEFEVPNKWCKIEFVNYQAVQHVKGKENKINQDTSSKNSYFKELEVESNSSEITTTVSVCSSVPCSLADNVAIVEERLQLISMKPAVMLKDIWTHFYAPFHINKKFFRFNLGQIICYLCYEQVGRYIMNVRAHISGLSHLDRIKILRNIELENKSSNKQLLDIPGSLKNIVPAAHFSLSNNGFICNVCNCFFENTVVLSHMTGKSHGKKIAEMEDNNVALTTVTV